MSYEMHYTGTGYPTMKEIEKDARKRGFTHSYWASEIGFHNMYNGDTVVVYDTTDDMPELMKLDAAEYGRLIVDEQKGDFGSMDKRICYFAVEHNVCDDDDRHVRVVGYSDDDSMSKFFTELSKTICFDDCTDESVIEIVWHGERLHYAGWQPGMLYTYYNEEHEVVWEGCFPELDH